MLKNLGFGASRLHCLRQLRQYGLGLGEADASVGHADTVRQLFACFDVLAAFLQMAFYHHARDAFIASADLRGDIGGHFNLFGVLFAAVGVREVDHDLLGQACRFEQGASGIYMAAAVIGGFAAAQNGVAVVVASGFKNRGLPHFGHAHKGVAVLRRDDGVHRHFDAAIGAIFKTHGARQATG